MVECKTNKLTKHDYSNGILFDAGPIISLSSNNMLYLLRRLKEIYKKEFYITPRVKEELIDKPMSTKRFRYEALQVIREIREGNICVLDGMDFEKETQELLNISNKTYKAHGNNITLVHPAEVEIFCYAKALGIPAVAIDERTMRQIVENQPAMYSTLKHKLHTRITRDEETLAQVKEKTKGIKIIRSVEIAMIAYKNHLLDNYIPKQYNNNKKVLIKSFLWALKLNGCAISSQDIATLSEITEQYQ